MCHRLLFGTPGTMANVPITHNANAVANMQYHTAVNILEKHEHFYELL